MAFVSQFIGTEITDSADRILGRLVDFIVELDGEKFPPIIALVYKEKRTKNLKLIPIDQLANLDRDEIDLTTIAAKLKNYEPSKKDLWLYRDVLDKQIVDLEGTRVVRANDLRLGSVGGRLRIVGIDISTRGILRRIGLDRLRIFNFLKPRFIDWEKIRMVGKSLSLSTLAKELVKLHPADLANIVEDLNPAQSGEIMQSLDSQTAAKVFEELEPHFKHHALKNLDQKQAVSVLSQVSTDELVDYLKSLHENERHKILGKITVRKKEAVKKLIAYKNDTAGGLLSTEFVKGDPDWDVATARDHIREVSENHRSINFIYLVNAKNELVGTVSLRSLFIANLKTPLRRIMKRVRRHQVVHVAATFRDIARIMTKYNLSSVAVVDSAHKLLGIITVDDLMRQLVPHA
ncbi:MAG: CBS domain-containing protein [Patescibacteria group bacterium]